MYRFRFLLNNDYLKLRNFLEKRIYAWIKEWAFVSNVEIQIQKASVDKFDFSGADFFQKDGFADKFIYCVDTEFNWASFIFDNYYPDCPKDELLDRLIRQAKDNFFLDVFGFALKENNTQASVKDFSFQDVLAINLTIANLGTITLLSRESVLHGLLDEPIPKPSKTGLSRLNAIKDLKITASILANFGEVAFLDLINLAENKLIRSAEDIDNRFRLTINERSICDVALGKVGNIKSIIVQGVSK